MEIESLLKSDQLGFDYPIPVGDELIKAGRRHSKTQQHAWQKLVQAVAKTDGAPNIKRLKAGEGGSIDLDELGVGEGAWVTPHSGPAAGRHILVVKRPNGDLVLLGGLHKPNTRIDDKTDKEYLVDDEGRDIREASPEDYISNLSKRHFPFKAKGKPTFESEEEKKRKAAAQVYAEHKESVRKEYKGAKKVARSLVKEHHKNLLETLGLAEGTTLTSQSEGKIRDSFEKAALNAFKSLGTDLDKDAKKYISEFGARATSSFRRERRKKIDRVQEIMLDAAKKGKEGKDTISHLQKIRQIAKKIDISVAPIQDKLAEGLAEFQAGNTEKANEILKEAADTAVTAAFDHAEQEAAKEVEVPSEDATLGDRGNVPSGGTPQDMIDLISKDPNAISVSSGMDFSKAISRLKSTHERQKEEKQKKEREKQITQVPAYAQVDADPDFDTEADRNAFFDQVGEAQKTFAASRLVQDRAKEMISKISEEAAAAGLEERPRTAVAPAELAVSLQDIETAMASTGVTPREIKKEMALLAQAQNYTKSDQPGMYTVINEFWNDHSGNLLDPYMRMGSEYALAGLLSTHLPKEVLESPEVSGLLGKISTKVIFDDKTGQFVMAGGKSLVKTNYGGLVQRTSGSVAPVIISRRLAQLASRGEAEREKIAEIERRQKEEKFSVKERMDLGKEVKRLRSSPFAQHFGNDEFRDLIRSIDRWNGGWSEVDPSGKQTYHPSALLATEEKAMITDRKLADQIKAVEEQTKTGEILPSEKKLGMGEEINPRSKLGKALQKTESLESLRQRRQENLGLALGSLETSATLGVSLQEAHLKVSAARAGLTKVPEETRTAHQLNTEIESLRSQMADPKLSRGDRKAMGRRVKDLENRLGTIVSSPTIPTHDDVRIDIPGPVEHPDPETQALLRQTQLIAARDYARNQLGLSDSEIYETEGSAVAIPRGKIAAVGVDKNGAHVKMRIGGPLTPEDTEAELAGKKRKARGVMDKITRQLLPQHAKDRNVEIKTNTRLPEKKDHPKLMRSHRRSDPSMDLSMRLSQFNAFEFMRQPKMFDENGQPVKGSKGGLNTMVTGGGKTLAGLLSIADNHQNGEHMNYAISVPNDKVQDWVKEAWDKTEFRTVGKLEEQKIKRKGKEGEEEDTGEIKLIPPKTNALTKDFEVALQEQIASKKRIPIVVAVPDGPEMAKGYGINGWGKEQQHEFFKKVRGIIQDNGGIEKRNIVFVMGHSVDGNIHAKLTKTQTGWGHKYAQEGYMEGGPQEKAKEGDFIGHFPQLGIRGRIVDEPQVLLSGGETSNRSAEGKRILESAPMEYRMLLTATPARRQLSEAHDAVRWVARVPQMDAKGNYLRTEKGRYLYHEPAGLPSKSLFVSQMGGLGRGTFTHEHVLEKQARDMIAPWNIGDEQRERHFAQTVVNHEVPRTESQKQRQIEIEKNANSIVQRELEVESKKVKKPIDKLGKEDQANAMARALQYVEAEHRLNIHGPGVMRDESGEVARRTKEEGGIAQLPRVDVSDWKHNAKISTMVHQLKRSVEEAQKKGKTHQAVIVVDGSEQASAVERALETIYPPEKGMMTTKMGGKVPYKKSKIGSLASRLTGQRAKKPTVGEIGAMKKKFEGGEFQALIIDKKTAQGHDLQTADSLHMLTHLDDAGTLKQAHGRVDRSPRKVREESDINKEVLHTLRSDPRGAPSALARIAIRDAFNEAHKEKPGVFPEGQDVGTLPPTEIKKLLNAYRAYNHSKWQNLILRTGVFTETPMELHNYTTSDSPHDQRMEDITRRGLSNQRVTTPELMKDPTEEYSVSHEPSGEEVKIPTVTKGLSLFVPWRKSVPPYVRN